MSGAHTVQFIFDLIDRFSPLAARIGQSAQQAQRQLMGMGQAANAAEAGINRLAAGQAKVATSFERSARSIADAKRANDLYFQSANRIEQQQIKMLERHQARQGLINAGLIPGGGGPTMRQAGMHQMMTGLVGFGVAMGLQTGFSRWLDNANSQYLGRQKMGLVGFKGPLMQEAESAADAMTRKYKNLSRGQILEMLHEGVAIHGTAHDSIANIEQQAKLMSFMEAFEGGKHAKTAGSNFREVQAWIKSMEMKGVLNERDPVKRQQMIDDYIQAGMAMKVAYPASQLRLGDMLLMQKRAGTAWYNFSDEFRFGYAPAMAQERGGQIVGTALMSAFASIRGGKKLSKAELGAMQRYGLLDQRTGRWTDQFQQMWADNPYLAANDLAQRVAKKNKLDPHNEADKAKLSNLITKEFSWLFPNRTASTQFIDLVFNNENFKKHADYMALVRKEMVEIEKLAKEGKVFAASTKLGSESSAGKQWENLMAAIGGPMVEPYIARMNKFAGTLNWMSEGVNKLFRTSDGKTTGAGKIAGEAGMYGLMGLGGIAALAAAGFLWGGLKFGLGMLPFVGGGAAARMAAMPLMAGGGGMALAGAAGGATMVAATRVGWLGRAFGGLASAVGLSAAGLHTFHRHVNRMGIGHEFERLISPMARLGAIMRTTFAGYGLVWAVQHWRDLKEVMQDVANLGRQWSKEKGWFGGEKTGKAAKKVAGDLGVDLDVPWSFEEFRDAVNRWGSNIEDSLRDSGWGSYVRWKFGGEDPMQKYAPAGTVFGDEYRLPYGLQTVGRNRKGQSLRGMSFYGEDIGMRMAREQARLQGDLPRHYMQDEDYLSSWRVGGSGYTGMGGVPRYGINSWPNSPPAGYDPSLAPRSEATKEIAIRTEVSQSSPLTGTVAVTVNGTVDAISGFGTANVTGAMQGKSEASRGESSPALPNLGGMVR